MLSPESDSHRTIFERDTKIAEFAFQGATEKVQTLENPTSDELLHSTSMFTHRYLMLEIAKKRRDRGFDEPNLKEREREYNLAEIFDNAAVGNYSVMKSYLLKEGIELFKVNSVKAAIMRKLGMDMPRIGMSFTQPERPWSDPEVIREFEESEANLLIIQDKKDMEKTLSSADSYISEHKSKSLIMDDIFMEVNIILGIKTQ